MNVAGVILNLFVGPMDMVSFTFAPQSLLAPVGTLSLVLNLVAAPRIHGDVVTARDAAATALIVFGTALCVVSGADGGDSEVGKDPAFGKPTSSVFMCYVVLVGAVGASLGLALVRLHACGGHADALANASLAGLLGSTTVVAGKNIGDAVSLDGSVLRVVRAVIPLVALAPTHLYVLNRGMGRHSSVLFVPLNVAASLSANVLTGFFLYGEAPTWPLAFLGGAAVLLSGVLALAAAGLQSRETPVPSASAMKLIASAAEKGASPSEGAAAAAPGTDPASGSGGWFSKKPAGSPEKPKDI